MVSKKLLLYSVYNYGSGLFDYYQDGKNLGVSDTPPKKRLAKGGLGVSPEQAALSLPSNAKKMGSGDVAKGIVATSGVGSFDSMDYVKIGMLALSAVLLWHTLKKK